MKDRERVERYLTQVNVQRLKMVKAYGKALSYVSKLEHEPLNDLMTESEREELDYLKRRFAKFADKMDHTLSKIWTSNGGDDVKQ